MKFILILVLTWGLAAQAQTSPEMTAVNQNIAKEYPLFRQVGAAYSTIFGTMAIWQGVVILNKDKPDHDDFLATATVVVGSIRLVDGSVGLFRESEAEKLAKKNEIQDRQTLERLARDAYKLRLIRSGLIAANSVLFLSLYGRGDEDYKTLIYPGVIMGVIATFNLFRPTPEEKAFGVMPMKDGGALVFRYIF